MQIFTINWVMALCVGLAQGTIIALHACRLIVWLFTHAHRTLQTDQ